MKKKTEPANRLRFFESEMRLLRDRFRGAFADTGTAVNSVAFINVRFAIDHRDRLNRARACTGFASDALCFINLSCHDKILLFSYLYYFQIAASPYGLQR